ncbi:MAG: hypothetical protein B7Y25_03270 [Alphaproteobacteria bacterium 16-39-46]|nr:MAG: hypothetical protein B7Y25_03270 [Alphaproteobacteria bacterium 16-39-46]OZA43358.1 MAG: hypothetical protein B7X84_03380 [Alphaproteobacteria bacterium 17-39-52]HQS83919.1 hypothetical protein [Alphaproteobacteria bacterium]HQS93815.1 hypothetical protein [Alphaproteobacteria bacterium]
MGRLKILTFCGIVISGFGFSNHVMGHWTSTLGGIVATLSGGAKCDSALSYASCRKGICKSEGAGDCMKNFCKTKSELIQHHHDCACVAGLTTKNCPQSSDENDPVVAMNRNCRSLWTKAQKKPIDCEFCKENSDKCKNIEGLFEWCSEKCPDKDSEEDENSERDDNTEGNENT